MGLGLSLVLIAVGATLTYTVEASVGGLDMATLGVILMLLGAIGLLVSMVLLTAPTTRRIVREDRLPPE